MKIQKKAISLILTAFTVILSSGLVFPNVAKAIEFCENVSVPSTTISVNGYGSFSSSGANSSDTVNVTYGQPLTFTVYTFAEPSSFNTISYPNNSNSYPGPSSGGRAYTTSVSITTNSNIIVNITQNCDDSNGTDPQEMNYTLQLRPRFTLTLNKSGSGSGTVTSSPSGISCGTSCGSDTATYNSGTTVTLSASAASGSTFSGWSGSGCSGTGSCVVSMTANRTVTATFTSGGSPPPPPPPSGGGNCGQQYCFKFVSQTINGVTNPSSITLNANTSYNVSVTVQNTGTTTWTAPQFRLGIQNPQDVNPLDQNGPTPARHAVPNSVPTGSNVTFNFTTTPVAAGNYNLQWSMVGLNWFWVYAGNSSGSHCSPQVVNTYEDACTPNVAVTVINPATGTITVTSNRPTSWSISGGSGPYADSCGGLPCFRQYDQTSTGAPVTPANYTISASALSGYSRAYNNATQTLTNGGAINFEVYYLANPTGLSIDTATQCGQARLAWNDNADNETGYKVFRSSNSGGPFSQIGGNLPANTESYTDNVAGGTYYYYIQAYLTVGGVTVTADSSHVSASVVTCSPNLGNSSKTLPQIQKGGVGSFVAYNQSTTTLADGDVLRFRITISNSGTAAATITGIDDTLSNNLRNPTNLRIDKGSGFVGASLDASAYPLVHIPISGSLPPSTNWVVEFDVTLQSQSGDLNEFFKNIGDINYTDATGSHTKTVTYGPILFKKSSAGAPTFKEISP